MTKEQRGRFAGLANSLRYVREDLAESGCPVTEDRVAQEVARLNGLWAELEAECGEKYAMADVEFDEEMRRDKWLERA